MIFEGFKLHAIPTVREAYCTNPKCKKKPELTEVSNGFLSMAFFCTGCKSVYLLKLERHPKVPKKFLQQCLDEIERNRIRSESTDKFDIMVEQREAFERDKRLSRKPRTKKKNGKS